MFYQVEIRTETDAYLEKNKTREEAMAEFVCPYLNREITLYRGGMFNMAQFANLTVFQSDRPIDSEWPVSKADWDSLKEGAEESDDVMHRILGQHDSLRRDFYEINLRSTLPKVAKDVTSEIFAEAVLLIDTGQYKDLRKRLAESRLSKSVFFICPIGVSDVDHNYSFVIKPAVEKHQFTITRADEISHTREINDVILESLAKSTFAIADLTDARPNCYYEVGYAHALNKPVIIIAREGTSRHFDISTYKWNYWTTYEDLKPTIEREIEAVLAQ